MSDSGNGPRSSAASWLVRVLGVVLAIIGVILAVGGAWLVAVGGSPYYLLAGIGLIVSGVLLVRLRMAGVWLYAIVFGLTVIWALWEAGPHGWPLVPRLVGPAVLMLLVILAAIGLAPGPGRGRRAASWSLLGYVVACVIFCGVIYSIDRPARAMPLPTASSSMSDPSPVSTGADWPAYGGSYAARRYSPLDQITPANVGRLQQAWVFHTGDLPNATTKSQYGAENTPLKIGDTLYVCTPMDMVVAVDPATGHERWRYDPKVSSKWIPYTADCRGVSYYAVPGAVAGSPCATRIIWGTLDDRLIAVDARTGRPCADFGTAGQVDTKIGFGRVIPGMLAIDSAPTIVRGVVVIDRQVTDVQRRDAPSGAIQGFDAVTGKLRWTWDMKRPDLTSHYPGPGDQYSRGTPNSWTTASGDEQLGLVYIPTGNSADDYLSATRSPAENQYSSSIVAIDAMTGKPVWSFQAVHKDVWDYDFGAQATLIDFPTAAGPVPALVVPSKQGDIYILDRRTGRPLTPVVEKPVPQGGLEAGQRAATQPFSLYHTLRKPPLTEAQMWGMSPIDQMICRIQFRTAIYQGYFTPPEARARYIEYPGYNGGSDWGGVAVDPVRGIIVANYNDMPNYTRLIPRAEVDKLGWYAKGDPRAGPAKDSAEGDKDPQLGVPYGVQVNAGWRIPFTGMLCKQPPYGGIRAIDIRTGKTLWDRPLGIARRNGPFGIASHLPITIGTPNNGGSVVTASGLVFVAAATDDLIRAIDLRTGKVLWQAPLPGGGQATPMTYTSGGKQFLVIMAGGHHFMGTPISDALLAYALPSR